MCVRAQALGRQPLWNALLGHFREQRCLVEGPLSALKPSLVQLARPSKARARAAPCSMLGHAAHAQAIAGYAFPALQGQHRRALARSLAPTSVGMPQALGAAGRGAAA
jgi:hypothetical protein